MYTTILIICLVSAGLSLISSRVGRRKPTKRKQRITNVLAVILFFSAITSGWLGYRASIETEDQAAETIERVDRAEAQITDIRTPRRMEPETKRMLAARLKPYAGQKYDMKVFGDQDSLELATAIQTILEERGWVYTNVYPIHSRRRYAETSDDGVFIISGKAETRRTSEARIALRGALIEAGLYDDSNAFNPVSCIKISGPIQNGTKVTRIPCSESAIQSIEIGFTIRDEVIPDNTLVLHVGKERL
ncbi:MAG: hypothetical protein OXK82_05205 [Deltaproteobacteria bacterium]|nr:hypothetical protein [Deltaproteobacteria bacterium]